MVPDHWVEEEREKRVDSESRERKRERERQREGRRGRGRDYRFSVAGTHAPRDVEIVGRTGMRTKCRTGPRWLGEKREEVVKEGEM